MAASVKSHEVRSIPLPEEQQEWIKSIIRDVPDFPKEGIVFKDLTTLMKDAVAFKLVLNALTHSCKALKPTIIVGIEARGFILAPAIAHQLDVGFVPIRKPGKLPWQTEKISYALEYGEDTIEIHKDAVTAEDRVVIIDDLLATGGTALAAKHLLRKLGANIVGAGFVVELDFLDGRKKLLEGDDLDVYSVIHY